MMSAKLSLVDIFVLIALCLVINPHLSAACEDKDDSGYPLVVKAHGVCAQKGKEGELERIVDLTTALDKVEQLTTPWEANLPKVHPLLEESGLYTIIEGKEVYLVDTRGRKHLLGTINENRGWGDTIPPCDDVVPTSDLTLRKTFYYPLTMAPGVKAKLLLTWQPSSQCVLTDIRALTMAGQRYGYYNFEFTDASGVTLTVPSGEDSRYYYSDVTRGILSGKQACRNDKQRNGTTKEIPFTSSTSCRRIQNSLGNDPEAIFR